jgi:hypothetical protein
MNFPAITTAAAFMFSLLLPLGATATLRTLTFDSGYDDPTVLDPTGEYYGPHAWFESGARIDTFWAESVGTAAGRFVPGHLHHQDNVYQPDSMAPNGYEAEYTHSYTNDLQGLIISLENGATFDLISIDYDIQFLEILEDEFLDRLPWSFAANDPKIIVSESFDPTKANFEGEWTAFDAISTIHGSAGPGDWHTLDFTGAGLVDLTSIMISQTATQTWFDNIVIDVHDISTPVPEPSTVLMMGLGLIALASGSRRGR